MSIYGYIAKPILFMNKLYNHYVSRYEENEADAEAVKNGYGEDLIGTFKQLSSDELVEIYPHPIIEFIEHSHPGMYNRIKTIQKITEG